MSEVPSLRVFYLTPYTREYVLIVLFFIHHFDLLDHYDLKASRHVYVYFDYDLIYLYIFFESESRLD